MLIKRSENERTGHIVKSMDGGTEEVLESRELFLSISETKLTLLNFLFRTMLTAYSST